MRLVAYTRVSTTDQAENGYGLGAQQDAIKAYCDRLGHELVAVFEEQASGSSSVRPILDQAIARLEDADGLIVMRLDRFVRSVIQFVTRVEQFDQANKTLISVMDNLDMSSPAGRMMSHVLAAVGQYERDLIGQRTQEGLAHRKSQGFTLGRPVTRIPDEVMQSIKEYRSDGLSLRWIAEKHNVTVHTVRRVCGVL